jgi:vacuolar-type H+-ATPase subunit E/Vma4
MRPLGSVAAVIAAIREDALAEAEGIDARANDEVERIQTLQAADVVTVVDREPRLQTARRQAQARLAQEDWEDTREAMAVREEWLQRALELGHDLLTRAADARVRRDRLTALASEALQRLPGRICEIEVSPADEALLGQAWGRDLARATGRDEIHVVPGPIDGGCVVRTPDGRASFTNTFAARASRFQPVWRAALAELYEETISAAFSSERQP